MKKWKPPRCFFCDNFLGCTEPGDIICSKEKECLNIVDSFTLRRCKKNNWFKAQDKCPKCGTSFYIKNKKCFCGFENEKYY